MNEKETLNVILREIYNIKKAVGRVECDVNHTNHEFKVYSQWGEDGIIQWIVNNILISRQIFIEFGVENYEECNTRFLLENNYWSGLVIDGNERNINHIKGQDYYWRYNIKAESQFITKENINSIIKENGIEGDIGLLSIDIDGNDYWIWDVIDVVSPDIVVVEYNSLFGKRDKITTPYKSDFIRQNYDSSYLVYGASISALEELGDRKGYYLVAGNRAGNNLFFVKKEKCNDIVHKKDIKDVYIEACFREARDRDGKLTYENFEERRERISNSQVWSIDEKKLITLRQVFEGYED